ncbi:hypothetical protein ACHAWU_009970 [Discostella pseudostelligera]|uniref:Uncharacterized protein n=1 Tax=Discostella pseudostelligera TaxID=259834 RepID=A0ABD3MKM1_9STRA
MGSRAREAGIAVVDTPATWGRDGMQTTEERGDAAVHGFWQRCQTTIFDVRITDTDARSARGRDFAKVQATHEKEKKNKYLQPCERHGMWRGSWQLIWPAKWGKGYLEMVHYV